MDWNRNFAVMSLDPELLENWLSWAGSKLIALPSERIKPALPKACWPDYEISRFQILEFRKAPKIRVPAPSRDEIPIMETILLFPNYCEFVNRRRVLHLRLLTNPFTMNPINSWNKISKELNSSIMRVQRWHYSGLIEASGKIPLETVNSVSKFFADLPLLELEL